MRMPGALTVADPTCPQCGYALAGLSRRTCPECGFNFDPVVLLWRQRSARRRGWLLALAIMAFAMYAPFSWLLFIDYPWNDYHWLWLRMWPILPGLPATILLRFVTHDRLPDWGEFVCMGIFAFAALLLFAWLGTRGKWWLIMTAIIVLALSCYNGWVGYMLFQL